MTSKLIQQAQAKQPDGRFPEFPPRDDMNNPHLPLTPRLPDHPAPALRLPRNRAGNPYSPQTAIFVASIIDTIVSL